MEKNVCLQYWNKVTQKKFLENHILILTKRVKTNNILFVLIAAFLMSLATVEISAQTTRIEIKRFDKAFYSYLQSPTKSTENKLRADYPEFLPAFVQIAQSSNSQTVDMATIRQYFSHPMLKNIYKDEQRILADLTVNEKTLAKASELIGEYLPRKKGLPQLAIHVSGFKENVIVLDGMISISGDRYLGRDYEPYRNFFSEGERMTMNPSAIARDLLKAWILSEKIVKNDTPETLMSAIIEKGKTLFLLSKLLPDYSEEQILLIDKEDIKSLEASKSKSWNNIIRQNLLMSTDKVLIDSYVEDNIKVMKVIPTDGKFMRGIIFGWDIVRNYAEQTNATVQQVLDADATLIMKTVRYNP